MIYIYKQTVIDDMVKTFYTNIRLKTGKLDVVQRMKCQHFYDSDLRVYTQFILGITS